MSLNKCLDFESLKEMRLLSADFIGASGVTSARKAECKTAADPKRHGRKISLAKSGGIHVSTYAEIHSFHYRCRQDHWISILQWSTASNSSTFSHIMRQIQGSSCRSRCRTRGLSPGREGARFPLGSGAGHSASTLSPRANDDAGVDERHNRNVFVRYRRRSFNHIACLWAKSWLPPLGPCFWLSDERRKARYSALR